jgi:hypothetical protein
LDVFQPEKSQPAKLKHLENMPAIVVAWATLNAEMDW